MQITISGKNVDIGKELRQHVETHFPQALTKYFEHPVDGQITFSRDGSHLFRCDCSVHLKTGLVANASAENSSIHTAFDVALDHLEKQIRRYKRRIRNHHN